MTDKQTEQMRNIAQRIRYRREELQLSFQQLADFTKMSKSTLQRYETGGIKNIPLDKLEVLADGLKTTPEWILGWDKHIEENKIEPTHNVNNLSPREQLVITAYHNNPDMQPAIDRILGIKSAKPTEKGTKIIAPFEIEDDNKQKLLNNYDKLNDDGQSKLLDYSADLVSGGRYVKNNQLFGDKEA